MFVKIYRELFKEYGPQGWWPLSTHQGSNPTKSGQSKGYHPNNYSFPRNELEIFEICIGAILTQSTSWVNVESALKNLIKMDALNPEAILKNDSEEILQAITPALYFNQKYKKIKFFSEYFIKLNGSIPQRNELLEIWGVGPETADSILLYAYKQNFFVVDAYTRRIFESLNLVQAKENYESIRSKFENSIPKEFTIYQEYHALIVEHAKHFYSKKPYGKDCFLLERVNYEQ